MKVYCLTCREYILETSDAFEIGKPPHGGMFLPATLDRWAATMFDCRENTKGGDLHCPRCMGRFLGDKDELLTEHGIVYQGQESTDEEFSIVHKDGPLKGQLMRVADSVQVEAFVCEVCGNDYSAKSSLVRHMREKHGK